MRLADDPPARLTAALAALLATTLLGAGCVIIVEPGGGTPTPVPVPISCQTSDEVPTAHVYFSLRIERSTANLAGDYEMFMRDTALGLAAAGIQTTHAVLVRAQERDDTPQILAAWGCALDDPDALPPSDVIRHYAAADPAPNPDTGCAVDPLLDVGGGLVDQVTEYPPQLPGRAGRRIFGEAPDVALVVHLDALARRTGFDEPGCEDAARLAAVREGELAFLEYPGPNLLPDQIAHWFVVTEEQMARDTFVARCRGLDGFPSDKLDLLEPSPKPLYGPLSERLAENGGPVAVLGMCRMLTDRRDFLQQEVPRLAGMVGLDVDVEAIRDVFENGLPTGEEAPEPGTLQPGP